MTAPAEPQPTPASYGQPHGQANDQPHGKPSDRRIPGRRPADDAGKPGNGTSPLPANGATRQPGIGQPTRGDRRLDGAARMPPGEDADPYCLSPADTDRLLAGAPWRRFAVLGDGLAAADGDGVPGYQDAGWGDRVAAALARCQPDLAYTNVAERDPRTADVRATQLDPVLDFRPDLALVVAGSNDILRRDFERCDDLLTDYDAIVTALQEAGADVVTATIFDVTRSSRVPASRRAPLRRRLEHLAGQIRLVARARGTVHLDLAEHSAAGAPDVYGADLRFATRRGHAVAAAALVRRLAEHLAAPPDEHPGGRHRDEEQHGQRDDPAS